MRIGHPWLLLLLSSLVCALHAAAREHTGSPTTTPIAFHLHKAYNAQILDDDSHGSHQIAFDISDAANSPPSTAVTLQATPTVVLRPRDPAAFQHARLRSLHSHESEPIDWKPVRMLAPDVQDKHTLSQLARMTGNAYALPGRPNWYEIDPA